jgi:integrase
MTTSTTSRERIARRRATQSGLHLSRRGAAFTLTHDDATIAAGPLGVIEAALSARYVPNRPGPIPTVRPPTGWSAIEDYLVTLAAAGQRDATIRYRRRLLCTMARGLRQPPAQVTAETLVAWFGRQHHWAIETRRSYRAAARGFFAWAYKTGRVPVYLCDELPKVRQPKASPRPAPDTAWVAALGGCHARVALMIRLAGEAGLRRAEVAQVHARDLIEGIDGASLLVHGKGGKKRVVPISDTLAALLRLGAAGHTPQYAAYGKGWLFPNGSGGHMAADGVGRLVAGALPAGWTMHTLRHRFATRAYRGSRNLRAVQMLLGHESISTTERYTAVDDCEIRAAMMAALA